MSNLVVFDTSIFIDHLRTGSHQQRIETLQGLVRTSSVVLAELWRGANREEQKFLVALERNHPVLTPTRNNWLESGQVLAKICTDKKLLPGKLRDLHFDALIALTARSHGARLITSNRIDFQLICTYRQFELEIW